MEAAARPFHDELALFAALEDENRTSDFASGRCRRTGRPRVPPDRKTEPFSLRLAPAERRLVEAAIARLAVRPTASSWARAALVEAACRLLAEPADPIRR